jgi:S1-C subfamily serine protease
MTPSGVVIPVIALITLSSALAGAQDLPLSTAAIAARATPATVTILTFGSTGDTLGQGSGFLVRSTGVIVTNWHVIAGAISAVVILASGERYTRVLFLDGDSTRDVALLQIPGSDLPTVPTRADIPPVGTRVTVIGSPLGLARTVTEGVVSAHRLFRGLELAQISAPISPGSSGGPVLDDRGRVFAIASAFLTEGQQLNFAVPVRYAVGMLALRPTPKPLAASPAAVAAPPGLLGAVAAALAPARATAPRPTLGGTYRAAGLAVVTIPPDTTPQLAVSVDRIVVTDSGYGWLGVRCDSSGICGAAFPLTARTVAGSVVLDAGVAGGVYDGYQTDTGFVATAHWTSPQGRPVEARLVGWRVTLPLSRFLGVYNCQVRTQDGARGGPTDHIDNWTGEGAGIETQDSLYFTLELANTAGGSTGGRFHAPRRRDGSFQATLADRGDVMRIRGTWEAGQLRAEWTDEREEGVWFRGPLTCTRG